VLVFDATALTALFDAHPPVWAWWKRADDGQVTLGFPAAAIVEVGETGEVTPNQWSTLLWPETIEVLPLGESAAVEIGSWTGTLAARQSMWEARALGWTILTRDPRLYHPGVVPLLVV
jgi:hypothetical protein